MTTMKKFCDRCGKETTLNCDTIKYLDMQEWSSAFLENPSPDVCTEEYDLCDECAKDFKKFMKEKSSI